MTDAERLIWDDYIQNYPTDRGTLPPDELPRTPAEWDEAQGVIITWASYNSNLREIVRYAKEVVKVYIICSSPTTVQSYLSQGGVNTQNIEFVVASFNSVWVRDYGPQSIYLHGTNELAFVDWVYNRPRPQDDLIPSVMATYLNLPIYQMTNPPNKLVATGGNFMTDGFGKGFSSNLIIEENSNLTVAQIDTIVKHYMNVKPYIKMTTLPYDDIHHIDMHIKLLNEETLLVGQYPTGIADGPQIEANLNYILNNFQTPYGRPYRVVRIPMPPDEYGEYPNQWSDYLTYTNSIILNNLVLVPIYGLPQDNQALEIYQQAMPGYTIIGLDMRNVIPASGAIHCITHEIAANDPIFIAHPPYYDLVEYSGNGYPVNATISSASGIESATLYWSTDTNASFNPIAMTVEQDTFRAQIPVVDPETKVYYYISATNGNGKTINKPLVAPEGLYVFDIGVNELGFDFTTNLTEVEISQEVEFTFINQGVNAQSFLWHFGEGANPQTADTEGPHAIAYEVSGSKDVTLTVNGDLVLTKTGYISVTEPPTYYNLLISIVGNGSTVPAVGSYQYIEGELISLSATPDEGWVFESWQINGTSFTSAECAFEIFEDTEAIAYFVEDGSYVSSSANEMIHIYPNPSTKSISFTFPLSFTSVDISFISSTGNTIKSIFRPVAKYETTVNISDLQPGVYVVMIKTSGGVFTKRFTKI